MFTQKEIWREIRESKSKARIYRKPKGRIFLEPKSYAAKTLILAKNGTRGLGLQTGPARASKVAICKIFGRVSVYYGEI